MSIWSRLLGTPDVGTNPFSRNSLESYAARWVQWGAATSRRSNPIADESGLYARANQPDDVWFLAGCFGGTVKRKCTIPANKKVFFPVVNMWYSEKFQASDVSEMYGNLQIDGKEIELESIFTQKPFEVKGVFGNPVTGSIFAHSLYVGGLWKLIDPLSPGNHVIHFQGRIGDEFSLNVTYYLTVKP